MSEPEIDEITGFETTGHEWDGLKELDKPLPRWWVWMFYATVIWAIGYWIAMPAWPLVSGYTRGLLGYSQRQVVTRAVADAKRAQSKYLEKIKSANLQAIRSDQELLRFSLAGGEAAFGDNCAPCHGRGAQGAAGYPNLNDDDWLWGGKLEDIYQTLRFGIRSGHDETRQNKMPEFAKDEILKPNEIADVTEFVLMISGQDANGEAAGRGKTIFAEQCAVCHGEEGKGNMELGAPNLTDRIWLYGGLRQDIKRMITSPRSGVMPAWDGRLAPETLKELAIYVHALGGGQ